MLAYVPRGSCSMRSCGFAWRSAGRATARCETSCARSRSPSDARSVETAEYACGAVRYVGFEDLLGFKNIAGRDQDLIDIRALREARDDIAP